MIFSHDSFKKQFWFEDCPMINPTLVKFAKSGKRFLYIYRNSIGEYLGDFYDEEPGENLFIDSYKRGDMSGALFVRNENAKVDVNDVDSIENSLELIDQEEFDI